MNVKEENYQCQRRELSQKNYNTLGKITDSR